jgi:rhodanese-related sulfurtransferase
MLFSFKNSRVLGAVAFSLLTVCELSLLTTAPVLAAAPAKALETPAKPTTKMPSPTNVTPAEAEALIHSHKQLLIIDVRTQEEFAEGHISGARNVNFNSPTFLERMKEFEGKSILVHCAAGGRSTRALEALSNASFAEVYHLNKGFNGWIEAGKPISTK